VRDPLRPAVAALSFLTAAPVGRRVPVTGQELRRGVILFPVVGALVGALTGLVGWGAAFALPPPVAAILGVAAGIAATGALHLDGLADTLDGVGASLAGDDPAPAMADPRLGTWGGAALVFDLLLKVSVLSALLDRDAFPWATVAAGTLGRMSIVALALAVPYAGPEDGAGGWTRGLDVRRCLVALGIGGAICVAAVGSRSIAMTLAAAAVSVPVALWSSRHVGGMRGDSFGAAAESSETFALAASLLSF
jgi:adenosylcobinamide-GDP ribazoletransferase